MSRKAAHRKFTPGADGGMVAWLRGVDLDESPMAYRRLPEVAALHATSIPVLHRLRPFGVLMAGAEVFDPFKD